VSVPSLPRLAQPFRTYRGRIAYVGDATAERGPIERGREWFTVTVQPSGERTINARCEIDDSGVVRDVVYSVRADWSPVDAFIRLNVRGRFMGSGWFRFSPTMAECETYMAEGGRVSQRIFRRRGDEGENASTFGAHPVACDVWHLGSYDPAALAVGQTVQHCAFMSSLLPNGASGPMLSTMAFAIEYLGPEELTVPAGTFATQHFRYRFSDGHPDEHVWFTSEDRVLVRIRWDLLRTTYELVEFERSDG
jgi:hypothetical protein